MFSRHFPLAYILHFSNTFFSCTFEQNFLVLSHPIFFFNIVLFSSLPRSTVRLSISLDYLSQIQISAQDYPSDNTIEYHLCLINLIFKLSFPQATHLFVAPTFITICFIYLSPGTSIHS